MPFSAVVVQNRRREEFRSSIFVSGHAVVFILVPFCVRVPRHPQPGGGSGVNCDSLVSASEDIRTEKKKNDASEQRHGVERASEQEGSLVRK